MTYNPLNQQDVRRMAGNVGIQPVLQNAIPTELDTGTTGGGSVSANPAGVRVECGATSGDKAWVYGMESQTIMLNFNYLYCYFQFAPKSGSGTTDAAKIGWLFDNDTTNDRGMSYDVEAEQYNVNGTTAAAPSLPSNRGAALEMGMDLANNETEFKMKDGATVDDTTTVANADLPGRGLIHTKSNGAGDGDIRVWTVEQIALPEVPDQLTFM